MAEDGPLGFRQLSQYRRFPLLRPHLDAALEFLGHHHGPVRVPRHEVVVRNKQTAGSILGRANVESPQQFGKGDEQRPLGEMNARAQSTAEPVSVVVPELVVGHVCVFRRQSGFSDVVVWVKVMGIGEFGVVIVKPGKVDHDGGVLGQGIPVDLHGWILHVSISRARLSPLKHKRRRRRMHSYLL